MLSVTDINVLGSIIDATYGRSSSSGGGGVAVRMQLAGDCLVVTYHEVINVAKDADKFEQVNPAIIRGKSTTKSCIKKVEDEFSQEAGKKLNLKVKSEGSELEAMSYNFMSPVRPTLLRFKTTYEIK